MSPFLVEQFRTPPDAEFAAPDVLRWKLFDPRGTSGLPSNLTAFEGGRIVGYGGMCHGSFHRAGEPGVAISTMHAIDWVASPEAPRVGGLVMLPAHRFSETQYALNYNENARRVIVRVGYEPVCPVPVFQRTLRPGHRLRAPGRPSIPDLARTGRDLARTVRHRPQRPRGRVSLRPVAEFGPEVEPILAAPAMSVIYSSRRCEWLNHTLRYPRGQMTGWLIDDSRGEPLGFALLSLMHRARARRGKIVECFLARPDAELWHAAVAELVDRLRAQGADVAETFGSTPWMADALRRCGFVPGYTLQFLVRDPRRRLPRNAPFHLTPFEADYAHS